jgi:uncharacterized protein YjiS (DUF1127 family)
MRIRGLIQPGRRPYFLVQQTIFRPMSKDQGAMGKPAMCIDINPAHLCPAPRTRPLVALVDAPFRWLERVEQRRRLRALDGRLLRDLGMSGADVEREAGKAFWQA